MSLTYQYMYINAYFTLITNLVVAAQNLGYPKYHVKPSHYALIPPNQIAYI